MEEFTEKFQIEKLKIHTIGSWVISVRPQQITIGSLVLSLNRKCPHLGEITEQEGKELRQAFQVVETLLDTSFKADKVNYLALMMVDEQVHFHIIPRYEESRTFNKKEFKDKDWPKPPSLNNILNFDDFQLNKLKIIFQDKIIECLREK